ncbi:MAG: hypothetical protein U0359_42530 [Byssovorax sp.]
MIRKHAMTGLVALALLGGSRHARAEDAAGAQEDRLPQPAIQLALDAGVTSRSLAWKDDLFGQLRPYTLGAAPIAGGEIAVYPAAIFTRGPLTYLGLAGRVESMMGIDSKRSGTGTSLPTHAGAFSAGLRLRAPLRFGAAFVDAGLAGRSFVIESSGAIDPDFPSTRFFGPRFGLGAELALPLHLALAPRAGASLWTTQGDLRSEAWFPAAQSFGFDAGLRLGVSLPFGLAPYADVSWSRDIMALHPEVGAAHVAGGAADDRFAGKVGIAWTLGPPAKPFRKSSAARR